MLRGTPEYAKILEDKQKMLALCRASKLLGELSKKELINMIEEAYPEYAKYAYAVVTFYLETMGNGS